ncbi:MAG: sigma-70 family RNA polymerase sigma factor [Nocardioides sp.]
MDATNSPTRERELRFRDAYDAAYGDVLRFVRRRVHPTHAEDVVADVMLVAWRRLDDLPADTSAARAWLFGVARNTLLNAQRSARRREAVAVRLADDRSGPTAGSDPDLVALRVDVAAAWSHLRPSEQEAISLVALDALTAPEAAAVLGISRRPSGCASPVPAAACAITSTTPARATP